MYDLERYLTIRSAYGASFSPDGDLSVLLDTTGVPQVWTLTEPGEWPVQRTFYDERVTFASWSPERRELAFGMDRGGNERAQLYRLDPDDGTITELTDRPDAKHRWGGWSHDGDRFAFASNRRDESVFDVYVQERDETGDDARLVHEGEGWLSVGGWSPDDSRLLVSRAHWSFDQDLSVLDVESGELSHVTPHDGDVRFVSAEWGPDGEALYLVTDYGADTEYLARLDIETAAAAGGAAGTPTGDGRGGGTDGETPVDGEDVGEDVGAALEVVRDGGEWNVDGVAVDEETGRLLYSRNVDGYTELTAGELTGPTTVETVPTPDLPEGVAGGVSFDADADRYALSASGRESNTDVYVVEFATGETERWTRASTAGIPPETFRTPDLVRYPTFDDREIPGYLSLPADPAPGDTPVVVDVHGGPESQRRPSFAGLTQYLLSRGYAVFEPNVRGSTGYGREYTHLDDVHNRMDSVADLAAAHEWLADHEAVDADRVVVMGGSYGGFMVLAALTEYPDLWAAGVDVVGIANFVTFLENTGPWRRELREAEYGSLEADRAFLESVSPINNIEHVAAPLFVLHGANDPRVPVGEAEQVAREARQQGVPVEKLVFEDEGHGISKLENRIEAYTAVVEFLDEHV